MRGQFCRRAGGTRSNLCAHGVLLIVSVPPSQERQDKAARLPQPPAGSEPPAGAERVLRHREHAEARSWRPFPCLSVVVTTA